MMIPSSLMMMRKPWSFSEPTAPAKWSHDCSYYSINTQCSEEEDARRSIELEFLNQLRVKLLLGMVIDDVRCCQLLSVIVDWFYRYIHSFVPSSTCWTQICVMLVTGESDRLTTTAFVEDSFIRWRFDWFIHSFDEERDDSSQKGESRERTSQTRAVLYRTPSVRW